VWSDNEGYVGYLRCLAHRKVEEIKCAKCKELITMKQKINEQGG